MKGDLRQNLLNWYDLNQRDLPWRRTRDPYAIWLSEIMLQQTTVKTVIPYFEKFLKQIPTLQDLARAPESYVLNLWAGLGYYNRIRNFQKSAKLIVERGGEIPSTKEELLALPGLGDYTAAAIASIAFGQPVAVVDGNVMRVLSRLLAINEDISLSQTKKIFSAAANELLETTRPGDFNQAMMELGATVCTPQAPRCLICPVRKFCKASQAGNPEAYPVKSKKILYTKEEYWGVVALWNEKHLLRQRGPKEIMAGLWEFPLISKKQSLPRAKELLVESLKEGGGKISFEQTLAPVTHTIMNRRMTIYPHVVVLARSQPLAGSKWVGREGLDQLPLTTVTKKILKGKWPHVP